MEMKWEVKIGGLREIWPQQARSFQSNDLNYYFSSFHSREEIHLDCSIN